MKNAKIVPVLDLLKYARTLLAKRGGWTQGVLARDSSGQEVPYESNDAVCFCASGAVHRAMHVLQDFGFNQSAWDALKASLPEFKQKTNHHVVVEFNDRQKSKAPVIRAFDRAIAKLEAV